MPAPTVPAAPTNTAAPTPPSSSTTTPSPGKQPRIVGRELTLGAQSADAPSAARIISSTSVRKSPAKEATAYNWRGAFAAYREHPSLKQDGVRQEATTVNNLLARVPDLRNMSGQEIVDVLNKNLMDSDNPGKLSSAEHDALEPVNPVVHGLRLDPLVAGADPNALIPNLINLLHKMVLLTKGKATPEQVLALASALATALDADSTTTEAAEHGGRRRKIERAEKAKKRASADTLHKASSVKKKQSPAESVPAPRHKSMDALYSDQPKTTAQKQSVLPLFVRPEVYAKNGIFKIFGFYKALAPTRDEQYEAVVESLLEQLPKLAPLSQADMLQAMEKIAEGIKGKEMLVLNRDPYGLIELEKAPVSCDADPGKIIPTVLRMLVTLQVELKGARNYALGGGFAKDYKHLHEHLSPSKASVPAQYAKKEDPASPTKTTGKEKPVRKEKLKEKAKGRDKQAKGEVIPTRSRPKSMQALHPSSSSTTPLSTSAVADKKEKNGQLARSSYETLCKRIGRANEKLRRHAVYGLFKVFSELEAFDLTAGSSPEDQVDFTAKAVGLARLSDREQKQLIKAGKACRENASLLGSSDSSKSLAAVISMIGAVVAANSLDASES